MVGDGEYLFGGVRVPLISLVDPAFAGEIKGITGTFLSVVLGK